MIEVLIPIGIVLIIVFSFFVYMSSSGGKIIKERNEKLAKDLPGNAKILSYEDMFVKGATSRGEYHEARFMLEVSSDFKSPYHAEVVWNIYVMGVPLVQKDCNVPVKIDADDQYIIYPDVQSVEYSWTGAIIEAAHKKEHI